MVVRIDITNLTEITSEDFRYIIKIYENEFPIEERKSIKQIEILLSKKIYLLFIVRDKYSKRIIGFAFVMFNNYPEFIFLDYMAIDPMFQRCGFGTILFNTIAELQKPNSLGILLDIERPDLAQNEQEKTIREKRKQFYLRLGCHMLKGIDYRLPSNDGKAIPMTLVFKPNGSIRILPADTIKQLIVNVYEKIHSDVQGSHEIFQSFISSICDQKFL